jgi:transcriptional regulator with XRE-family HTH domain
MTTPSGSATAAPCPVSDRAQALQRSRHQAGVVLPDIARKTGYSIQYLLQVETGALELGSVTYGRISSAITELLREKNWR